MILINLLPHRELARKRAKDAYNLMIILAAAVGAVVAAFVYLGYQAAIYGQESRNSFLAAENARLDKEIKEVASLQDEITALKARQQAVESLQANRNLPVYLFNAAVSMLPDGMYLTSIKQQGQNILFTGAAQSQERVSGLLRNLSSSNSEWLTSPQLIEIQAAQLALSARDQRRVYNFTVQTLLSRSSEAASAQQSAKTRSGA